MVMSRRFGSFGSAHPAYPPRSATLMLLPAAALALAGIGISLVPGLEHHAEAATHRFKPL